MRIAIAAAGVALVAVAVGTASAAPAADPATPTVPGVPPAVARTAPAQMWLTNLQGVPAELEPLPGTLSSGLTSRHIGG